MSDDQRNQGWPFAGCLAVAILLLPLLYVLSFGPACWLGNNGYLSDDLKIVYIPLMLLAQYCPPVGDWLEWYVKLWQ